MIESALNAGFLLQHDLSCARGTVVHGGSGIIITRPRPGRRDGVLSGVVDWKTSAKVPDWQDSCNWFKLQILFWFSFYFSKQLISL